MPTSSRDATYDRVVRLLLTESASLTCRETLTVLDRAGLSADVVSSGPLLVHSIVETI